MSSLARRAKEGPVSINPTGGRMPPLLSPMSATKGRPFRFFRGSHPPQPILPIQQAKSLKQD